jgi:hypothetical protein
MPDELSDEERELLAKHRAEKAKKHRKVTVRGKHESGAEYEFELDDDDAERVIARHRSLWADEDEEEEPEETEEGGESSPPAKPARKSAYFKK